MIVLLLIQQTFSQKNLINMWRNVLVHSDGGPWEAIRSLPSKAIYTSFIFIGFGCQIEDFTSGQKDEDPQNQWLLVHRRKEYATSCISICKGNILSFIALHRKFLYRFDMQIALYFFLLCMKLLELGAEWVEFRCWKKSSHFERSLIMWINDSWQISIQFTRKCVHIIICTHYGPSTASNALGSLFILIIIIILSHMTLMLCANADVAHVNEF